LKSENQKLLEEIQNMKDNEIELQTKINNSKNNFDEIDNLVNSILLIIKTYAIKFEVSDHINKNFERSFSEKIKTFLNFYNKNSDKEIYDSLSIIEDWVKNSCFQIEKSEQKNLFSNEIIEDSTNKVKRLEKKLNEASDFEEEKINLQKIFNSKIKQLEDEKKYLLEDKNNLEKEFDLIVKEFNRLKLETKSKIEELGDSEIQINELRNLNEDLKKQSAKQDKLILNSNFQEKALEERIKILSKEKKYFENLLIKLVSIHPVKNVSRVVNDIMNICDSISTLEREKIKIMNKLNNIAYETSQVGGDTDINISFTFKFEKEENMRKLNDLNREHGKIFF